MKFHISHFTLEFNKEETHLHIRRRDSVLVRRYLGDRAFFSRFLMIALPIAIQNGITNLVGLLDNVMVGQLGTMPMNGVSIVNQIMMVPYLCLFGAMAGAGIYTAQFFGSGDNDGIRFTFRFKGIACAFVVAGTMLFLSFYGANLIGLFLHSSDPQETEAALRYAMDYLRVAMWGLVPFGISQIYVSTMREVGQTVVPMKAGLAAVAINVGLNYLLIFGKLGLPAMGVKGAALATICARCVEGCVAIVWLHTHGGQFPFVKGLLRSPRIPPRLFVQILVKCVPLLINEGMWSGGVTMMHQCYSTRGLDAVAGISICATLSDVFIVFFIAAGDAIAIMVGQLLGADKKEEAKEANKAYRQWWVFPAGNTVTVTYKIMMPLVGTWKVEPLGDTDAFSVTSSTGSLSGNLAGASATATYITLTITSNATDKKSLYLKTTVTSGGETYNLDSETQLYDMRGYHYFVVNGTVDTE